MKTNNKFSYNKRSVGIAMSTLLLGASMTLTTSCKDDHFDVASGVSGTGTVWENIQSQENISQFASILKRLPYSKNETQVTGETYADVLNGQQEFTVWAPENGTFDYAYYDSLLNKCSRDVIYDKVEKEFVRNHIARFSKAINGTETERVRLFNAKYAQIDYSKGTIKGSSMSQTNIGANNGVLHVLKAPIPFQPNLYEFLALRPELGPVNEFVKKFETYKLNENTSTQGSVINGVVQWVDSVMDFENPYLTTYSNLNARIDREDSTYVMILPDTAAWNQAALKIENFYKYMPAYSQDNHTFTAEGKDTTVHAEFSRTQVEIDSISRDNVKNAIARKLAFSTNWQFMGAKDLSSIDAIRKIDAAGDSLRATNGLRGTVYKKSGTLTTDDVTRAIEVPNFAKMFGDKDPVEVSNGYAYIIDNYDVIPTDVYLPTLKSSSTTDLESYESKNCVPHYVKSVNYSRIDSIVSDTGVAYVIKNQLVTADMLRMSPKLASSHPAAYFELPQVLSAAYDIKVVVYWNGLPNRFSAEIAVHDGTSEKRLAYKTLDNPDTLATDVDDSSKLLKNRFENRYPYMNPATGEVVYADTVLLAKDYQFKVCYEGIENIYPALCIKSNFTSGYKNTRNRELLIGDIILEPSKNQATKKEDQ